MPERVQERAVARIRSLATNRAIRSLALVAAIAITVVNTWRVPSVSPWPLLIGLVPYALGKYILCALRWKSISSAGRPTGWYIRVYAEGDLLGLATPAHSGQDFWRVSRLHKHGMTRTAAITEVAIDRLVGAIGLTVFVIATSLSLPVKMMAVAIAVAALVLAAALFIRHRHPDLLRQRPMPPTRTVVAGVLLSLAYQATAIVMLMQTLAAVGQSVPLLQLLAVAGASHVAGMLPGIHGAGPREGALVAGLVALGVPVRSALGAVSLSSLVVWLPAIGLGGTFLLLREIARRSAASAAAEAAAA